VSIERLKPPDGTRSGKQWVARGYVSEVRLSVYIGSFRTREEAEEAEAAWWVARGGHKDTHGRFVH
jgi:hypothetical protein